MTGEAQRDGIDALRGLAVTGVWCAHLFAYYGVEVPLLGRLGGLLGVQLFFVVSGFLIVDSATRYPLRTYAIRRVLRIFPAYWAVVLAASLVTGRLAGGAVSDHPLEFVVNLLALSHWMPLAYRTFDVTTVSWSLTVELVWYALAPLLVALQPRQAASRAARTPERAGTGSLGDRGARTPQRAGIAGQAHRPRLDADRYWWIVGAATLAASTAWVLAAWNGWLDPLFAPGIAAIGTDRIDDASRFAYIVNAAPAHLVFFVAGALIFRHRRHCARAPGWLLALPILLFLPLADRWNGWLGVNPSFASGIGLCALFVWLGLRPVSHLRAPFEQLLAPVGRVSYPVYLLHVPMLHAVFPPLRDRLGVPGWACAILTAAVTLAISYLVHRCIEEPGIALGRRLTRTVPSHASTPRPV